MHVVGGGCFGSQYVRWLLRARDKGMVRFSRIVAIDRDPNCRLRREGPQDPALEIAAADWVEYFSGLLLQEGSRNERQEDQWVPAPLSPHIIFLGFMSAARTLLKAWKFRQEEFQEKVPPPVQVPLQDGSLAVSFAEWQCPVNCIEPANCPAIHAPRTWDMKSALREYFLEQESRRSLHVLQCRHWVHGVGTIPLCEIFAEFDEMMANRNRPKIHEVVVATTSGCHGLISRAVLTPLQAQAKRYDAQQKQSSY